MSASSMATDFLKKISNREVIVDNTDDIRDDLLQRRILIAKSDDTFHIRLTCSTTEKYFEKFTSSKVKSSRLFSTYPIIIKIRIKKGNTSSYQIGDEEYGEIKNDVYLEGFYNEISCMFFKENDSEEKRFWKGFAYTQLCYLLNYLIKNKYLEPENTIWLTALGELSGCMSMEGLIRYYENMGFVIKFVEQLNKITPGVAMITTVGRLIEICREKERL